MMFYGLIASYHSKYWYNVVFHLHGLLAHCTNFVLDLKLLVYSFVKKKKQKISGNFRLLHSGANSGIFQGAPVGAKNLQKSQSSLFQGDDWAPITPPPPNDSACIRICMLSLFKNTFFINYIENRIYIRGEGNLLEKSVKRPFCCTVSILQVYFTYLCYTTCWALEYHFIENLKLLLKENQIMK